MLACVALVLASSGPSLAAAEQAAYKPPVMRDNGPGISIWFGHVVQTGQWCAFDEQSMKTMGDQNKLAINEDGWARYGHDGLISATLVSYSEDAAAEDRYIANSQGVVTKMIRTGGYINDPLASVTFEPEGSGRLRLTLASKKIIERMKAAGYDPYFVDWDHFSRLPQLPFAKLLDLKVAPKPGACA